MFASIWLLNFNCIYFYIVSTFRIEIDRNRAIVLILNQILNNGNFCTLLDFSRIIVQTELASSILFFFMDLSEWQLFTAETDKRYYSQIKCYQKSHLKYNFSKNHLYIYLCFRYWTQIRELMNLRTDGYLKKCWCKWLFVSKSYWCVSVSWKRVDTKTIVNCDLSNFYLNRYTSYFKFSLMLAWKHKLKSRINYNGTWQ